MRPLLFVVSLVFLAGHCAAGTLFVDTSPPNATVVVNGIALDRRTPLIYETDAPALLDIQISQPGYRPQRATVELGRDEVAELSVVLEPDFVLTGFPEDRSVLRLQGELPAASFVRLPQGRYTIERDTKGVVVTPVYPRDALIGGLSVGTALGLATTIVSTLSDFQAEAGLRISPATVLSGITTLVLGLTDAFFIADRARFFATVAPVVVPANPLDAQLLLERAEIALEAGSLAFAEESLGAYVDLVPHANRAAESLYRQARILVSIGEFEHAIGVYERLISDYPRPEFYDRALLGLAEAYGRRGTPQVGLGALDRVTFVRPAPTREDVDLQRADLAELAYFADSAEIGLRVDSWLALVARYPDSPEIDFYRLSGAEALLDADRGEEAVVLVDLVDPDESLDRLYEAVMTRLSTLGYK